MQIKIHVVANAGFVQIGNLSCVLTVKKCQLVLKASSARKGIDFNQSEREFIRYFIDFVASTKFEVEDVFLTFTLCNQQHERAGVAYYRVKGATGVQEMARQSRSSGLFKRAQNNSLLFLLYYYNNIHNNTVQCCL